MARYRLRRPVWLFFALIGGFWLSGSPASARIQRASYSIYDRATWELIGAFPRVGMDLPPVLARPQDVYLLVTAGAAYTDVRVLAVASVAPARLAWTLQDAAAGTPLAGSDVLWSSQGYSAARLVQMRGHFGRSAASAEVPLGALEGGLRRAGFVPHVFLRVPLYASCPGLPPAPIHTTRFRWYDDRSLVSRPTITVQASLTPLSPAFGELFLFVLLPVVGIVSVFLGARIAARRGPLEARRRWVNLLTLVFPLLAASLWVPLLTIALDTASLDVASDLWLGYGSTRGLLSPALFAVPACIVLVMLVVRLRIAGQSGRRAAPAPWLSEEEKALQQRMNRWKSVTHVLGAVLLVGLIFLVPHRGPLSSAWHSFYQLFVALGAALVSLLFRKQTAALTKKTLDDDLTFRARRFGQLLGARPRDVWVEDSSRAVHFSAAHRDQGDHIVVSRKMRDGFTEAEMDFVLASLVARMTQARRGVVRLLPILALCLPLSLAVAPLWLGSAALLSVWYLPAVFGSLILGVALMLASSRAAARDSLSREQEADRKALAVTGDLAAAQSALTKTDAEVLPPVTGGLASSSGAAQGAGRLAVRRLALQRAGEASFG